MNETSALAARNDPPGIAARPRPLSAIARDIRRDWQKLYYGAAPYLGAMACMESIHDNYYQDSGASIVRYFLSNATQWKGETARTIKAELKALLKTV